MNNATMWLWWYGLLAGLPLVTLGLLVKIWVAQPKRQRVSIQRRER